VSGAAAVLTTRTGWRERLQAWRDRRIADPRFRRWAASFPLTRPVARRRTRALFDLCAGFVYAQILAACVELRLFDILAERPQTLQALALRLSLSPAATQRLLAGAIALRLVARRDGERFALGELGAAMVGNEAIAAMIRHHRMLYADLRDPVALLRGDAPPTALGQYWAYAGAASPGALGAEQVANYSALMAASQPLVAGEILDAYRVRRHRCLMDVGGGEGVFLLQAARRARRLRLILFDLPAVAARATERLAGAGLTGRATAVGGDFRAGPLPTGADLISLVRVLHDHDDTTVRSLLARVHAALPPGGTVLVAEPMAGTAGAEPMGDAYFGFYLLAMGSGRPRSREELSTLLAEAGFTDIRPRQTHTPLLAGVITARRRKS
jgi:demethylspheroidene O-methyltransferase